MATTIITKNGTGAPLASDLVAGELAVDLTNKRLYTEDSGGTIIEVGSNPSVLDVDNININGNAIISTDTNGNIDLTPNGTGEVNISKVDIDAGAIDGTAIGANSASTGAFTTLTASTSLNIASSTTVDGVLDEDTMSSNSATKLATQQSIKAYVDSQVGANNELSEVLANGNTTGSTNIVVTAGQSITTDSILETTAAAGVDIDGVLLKDTSVGTDDASGTDVAGTAVTVKGGAGTGTGAGGSLVFQTAPAGTTGSSANAQVTALTIDSAGDATFTGASYNMSWDKSANSLTFADNAKAVFGAGSDLQIYHDGSGSFVDDQGTGGLILRGTNLFLRSSANENYLGAVADGAVTIYHDNSPKLATTSTGIDVTGVITTDGLTTSADINFGDNDKAVFGAGSDLQIYHDGSNSYISEVGTGELIIQARDAVTIEDGTTGDNYVYMQRANKVALFYAGAEKLATTSTGIDVTGAITTSGNLTVNGADVTITANIIHSGDGDTYFGFNANDSYRVVTGGSQRLLVNSSGIDVTGTVTADGLTVDGTDTEAITSQLLKVRNSTTGEAVTIGMYAKADNGGDGNTGSITFDAGATGLASDSSLRFSADHQTDLNPALKIDGNRDISFYEDTGTTAKLFWDSSDEALRIGGTSNTGVSEAFTVYGDSSNSTYPLTSVFADTSAYNASAPVAGGGLGFAFKYNTGGSYAVGSIITGIKENATDGNYASALTFRTRANGANPVEAMRIESSGNVVIGATSVSNPNSYGAVLNVEGYAPALVLSEDTGRDYTIGVNGNNLNIFNETTNVLTIADSGNVGIGHSAPGTPLDVNGAIRSKKVGGSAILYLNNGTTQHSIQNDSNELVFYENASEAMRIDASGNLLVGATTTTNLSDGTGNDGVQLNPSGTIAAARTSNVTAVFNRLSTDGEIARFNKDGLTVGSIGADYTGTSAAGLFIGNGTNGLFFNGSADIIQPYSITGGENVDNTIDLGNSAKRFKDLYLSGGVYVGGTGAANKLDDYEEGTWTPAVDNADAHGFTIGTPTGANGNYIKVGNLVTLKGGFTSLDSTETIVVSDRFGVSGLPFTPSGSYTAGAGAQGSCIVYSSYGSGILATGTVAHSTDKIWIVIDTVHGSPTWGTDVSISISYIAN